MQYVIMSPEILYGPAMHGWLESSKGFHQSTHAMPDFSPLLNKIFLSNTEKYSIVCMGIGGANTELFLLSKIFDTYPQRIQQVAIHDMSLEYVNKSTEKFSKIATNKKIQVFSGPIEKIFPSELNKHIGGKKIITLFGYTLSNPSNFPKFAEHVMGLLNSGDYLIFDFPDMFMKDDMRLEGDGCSTADKLWYRSALQFLFPKNIFEESDLIFSKRVEDIFSNEPLAVENRIFRKKDVGNYRVKILAEIPKLKTIVEIQRYGRMDAAVLEKYLFSLNMESTGYWMFPAGFSYFGCARKL